ncbi:MAG: hypothetical protein CMA06_03385 [Euryarchaeota archaeon]|nr:hypothetical protein [Euryarchaeota archaeon]|tara:strand:+ start:1053 stop:2057 length:1005 start_codon:yes stop_codon:yes gene_type:complete
MRLLIISFFTLILNTIVFSQGCCSGGAGSPIAGGAATGVLQENQMEISINYQNNSSNKFFAANRDTNSLFNNLNSDYFFFRVDYGLSKKLTLSVASGYFLDKSKIGKDNSDTISSNGVGDLIIFPRYSIYNKTANFKRTAVVIGLGLKIPLGSHNDTTNLGSYGIDNYQMNPPMLQTTNGSQDLMFNSFFFREYQKSKLRLFISSLYVKKGYNSLGIKYGDYTSVGFFASKTFFYRWGVTAQLKAEKIDQIKVANNIEEWDLLEYSITPESTGSKKWFFIPQLSYSKNRLTVYATSEIPLYQYLNGTQIGSQNQFTVGVNYRFLTKKCEDPTLN